MTTASQSLHHQGGREFPTYITFLLLLLHLLQNLRLHLLPVLVLMIPILLSVQDVLLFIPVRISPTVSHQTL